MFFSANFESKMKFILAVYRSSNYYAEREIKISYQTTLCVPSYYHEFPDTGVFADSFVDIDSEESRGTIKNGI
jgi:hypothetical protein